ncbi:LrgB family protein [Ornithinibacillus xuwenensis]|uniref:LrgB family protein n=1 Tax=Ornithinibacillus xuwenensis TaxID=3144668 RepID=A0ABU9XFN4_9BACI
MINLFIGIVVIIATIGIYLVAVNVHHKYNYPFTAPVIISTIIVIVILLACKLPYDTYMIGGRWINELLGPAVVALAYPLYVNRKTLLKLGTPILVGSLFGSIGGLVTGIILSKLVGLSDFITYSLLPKNVTTAVAMDIAETTGGGTSLAAVFVMIAGIGGVSISSLVFKVFRVRHSLAKGLGLGSASHAIGTASAMEDNQLAGSIGSIAMILSAVLVSIMTPWMIQLLM